MISVSVLIAICCSDSRESFKYLQRRCAPRCRPQAAASRSDHFRPCRFSTVVKTLRLCYELRTAKLYRKMYWVARWELTRTFRRGLPTCHSRKCKLGNPKRNKSPQSFSAKNRVPECILHTEQEEVLLGEPAALSSCRSAGAATIVALPTTIALRTQVKR